MRCTEGDEVVAAASMQNDPIVAHVSELFALGKMISGRDIRGGQVRTPSMDHPCFEVNVLTGSGRHRVPLAWLSLRHSCYSVQFPCP
jgi:hypothetical protein